MRSTFRKFYNGARNTYSLIIYLVKNGTEDKLIKGCFSIAIWKLNFSYFVLYLSTEIFIESKDLLNYDANVKR